MQILEDLARLIGGLVILWVGGECLVRGAARLARSLGISALVVGLTVVAFGTSAPELAVAVQAAIQNEHGLAVGNVMGSNIANILLILGAAAAARSMKVSLNLLKVDGPIMFVVAVLFVALGLTPAASGQVERWEGLLLVTGLLAYVVFTYYMARREPPVVDHEYEKAHGLAGSRSFNGLLIGLGIVALTGGGRLIVDGATGLAEALEISKTIVGLTIVAIGTSLPELATSVIAVRRNLPDIAVGNVVGSNIFNVLSVIGVTAIVRPVDVARETMLYDAPVMLIASLLFLVLARSGQRISRSEGLALLFLYACYLAWMTYRATS